MALSTIGIVNQEQLAAAVKSAQEKLDPSEVLLVRYSVGVDSSGEITIFFRILLTDWASQESRLGDVTARVATVLFDEIRPFDNWGILPEFSFRSEAEQRNHYDAAWV
jgi:hypothetical protein